MNGEWLGSRAIRVNWANQKTQTGGRGGPGGFGGGGGGSAGMNSGMSMGSSAVGPSAPMGFAGVGGGMPPPIMAGGYAPATDYETIVAQTPAFNTTVYVGNLIPYSTQQDLIPLFQASRPVRVSVRGRLLTLAAGLRLHCGNPHASRPRLCFCQARHA